jgi:hypothetical protein
MSSGNGNRRISKYNRQVADLAGLKKGDSLPYAPDFLDSLARRMAIAGDAAERCLAWLIYRANGNHSLKAIHLYSHNGEPPVETDLDQRDCALELAWVEAGHRVEWLDAPLKLFREEAARRGVKPIDKSAVSRGFQFNRDRGSMESGTGQSLRYIPAPNAEKFSDARELCRTKGENVPNLTKVIEWAKISYARELQEYQVARSREQQLLKFLTARYKKENGSLASETNGGTSLEALEALETSEAAAAPVPSPVIDKTEENPPPPLLPSLPRKAEEEEPPPTFATFKALYPQHRFDEGQTKRIFEGMPPGERSKVIAQLRVYIECPRWVMSLEENQGQWIPLSSNWIKIYDADPPPLIRKHDPESEKLQKTAESIEQTVKLARMFRGMSGGRP